MEKVDWTKYLIQRTVPEQRFRQDVAVLDTTDFVTVPSSKEYYQQNSYLRHKSVTDFAVYCGCQPVKTFDLVHGVRKTGMYWLRDGVADPHAIAQVSHPLNEREIGIAPCISLALPEHYTLEQVTQQFNLQTVKTLFGKKYQASLGAFPQSRVPDNAPLFQTLCQLIKGEMADPDFRATGRVYAMNISSSSEKYATKQIPEYEYHGERYAWVRETQRAEGESFACFKVEPITWAVTNYDQIAKGEARQIDLASMQIVQAGIPFHLDSHHLFASLWQGSLLRAYLNDLDTTLMPSRFQVQGYDWNFRQCGFMQQALHPERAPLTEYTIPAHEDTVHSYAFYGCQTLEKILIPEHVKHLSSHTFFDCPARVLLSRRNHLNNYSHFAFNGINFKHICLPKSTQDPWLIFTHDLDQQLQDHYINVKFCRQNLEKFLEHDYYCDNFIQLNAWKAQKQIKFIPPEFTLQIFPPSEMGNYFVNNNHKRWANIVAGLRLDLLPPEHKADCLAALMKIYYAMGGFSPVQQERDQAFDYLRYVIIQEGYADLKTDLTQLSRRDLQALMQNVNYSRLFENIENRFSRISLKGPHQPEFAEFFMKYYCKNPNFMSLVNETAANKNRQDYLCEVHNSFDLIVKNFPNRVIKGTTHHEMLTPQFVVNHCLPVDYEHVDNANLALAQMIGRYGYSQTQFEKMQAVYNQAKLNKEHYVIEAKHPVAAKGMTFRVLAKDDPLGFVLGDITNCCQRFGASGDSCVCDGFTNPNAGFLVFETCAHLERRILGQAYVWYDPVTYTVCYDNIEIPQNIIEELVDGENHKHEFSMSTLMQTVINSADEIMTSMNQNHVKVERVTVGRNFNDLQSELIKHFPLANEPAIHRDYYGYTDAQTQYLIRNYTQTLHKIEKNKLRQLKLQIASQQPMPTVQTDTRTL